MVLWDTGLLGPPYVSESHETNAEGVSEDSPGFAERREPRSVPWVTVSRTHDFDPNEVAETSPKPFQGSPIYPPYLSG